MRSARTGLSTVKRKRKALFFEKIVVWKAPADTTLIGCRGGVTSPRQTYLG